MSRSHALTLTVLATGRQFDLNPADGAYTTVLPLDAWRMATAQQSPQTIERSGGAAIFTGSTLAARTFIAQHRISAGGKGVRANRNRLAALYDHRHGEAEVTFTDAAEPGITFVVRVKLVQMLPHASGQTSRVAQAQWLLLSTFRYESEDQETAPTALSSSPSAIEVSNKGNVDSDRLAITITPTVQKADTDGQRFLMYVDPFIRQPRAGKVALELTGDLGWDHAAEVTASRSQDTGADVRVLDDSVEVPRWFGDGTAAANQSVTRVWIAAEVGAGREWRHRGTETIGAADTEWQGDRGLTNIPPLPALAGFYDEVGGHEKVWVTAYSEVSGVMTIERGVRGSAAASHAVGTSLWWMPKQIVILYGDLECDAPFYDDSFKPIPAEDEGSSNEEWVFAVYLETAVASNLQTRLPRVGSWVPARHPFPDWTDRDELFRTWIPWTGGLGVDASPATKLAIGYRHTVTMGGHPLVDRWEQLFTVAVSELRYSQGTLPLEHPGPPNEGKLVVLGTCSDGTEIVIDVHNSTTTSETHASTPSLVYIAFAIKPWDPNDLDDNTSGAESNVPQEPDDDDGFEIVNLEVEFDPDERLFVEPSARIDAYQLGTFEHPATIEDEQGNVLSINGVALAIGATLEIDVLAGTALVDGRVGVAHRITGLRDITVPADPGDVPHTSELTFTEAGIGEVEIGAVWRSAWL